VRSGASRQASFRAADTGKMDGPGAAVVWNRPSGVLPHVEAGLSRLFLRERRPC